MSTDDAPAMNVPLMRPTFGPEEEQAVIEVLRSGWVTQGPVVAEFEKLVADYIGAAHAVAVTSCTTALFASLLALKIGPGDEVICPSHTYIATPNSVIHAGATPIFADIDETTYGIDPKSIEAAITDRTRAIMPVHIGMACDIDAVYEIARAHDLQVIEDAAPAIGAAYKDRMVGNSGGPVSFSFHPRKIISTGEGGMITTNDDALAEKLRLLRHHHMSLSDVARHSATDVVFETYEDVGYNLRMTDIQAAVGIAQMGKLERILQERRDLAAAYDEAFLDTDYLWPPVCPPERTHTYQAYIVRLTPDAPVTRDEFMRALLQKGIATRRGVMNSHEEPAYIERYGKVSLPVSEAVHHSTVILPLYSGMTPAEQEYVVDTVRDVLRG